jgi:RHS repeat-associated protein
MLIDSSAATTSWRYFHQDQVGSIDVVTDQTGSIVERLSYDAFGRRRNTNGTDSATFILAQDSYGYTDQEELDSIGLVNMNGRVYDPTIARFMSSDPTIARPFDLQSHNRYSYVSNRPFVSIDPTGFEWTETANDTSGTTSPEGGEGGGGGYYAVPNFNPDGSLASYSIYATPDSGVPPGGVTSGAIPGATPFGGTSLLGAISALLNSIDTSGSGSSQGGSLAIAAGGPLLTDGQNANSAGVNNSSFPEPTPITDAMVGQDAHNSLAQDALQRGAIDQAGVFYITNGSGLVFPAGTVGVGYVDGASTGSEMAWEFKPNNPLAVALGVNQLNNYLESINGPYYSGSWTAGDSRIINSQSNYVTYGSYGSYTWNMAAPGVPAYTTKISDQYQVVSQGAYAIYLLTQFLGSLVNSLAHPPWGPTPSPIPRPEY